MKTRIIEVTNGELNYGKFMVQQFDVAENTYRSRLPGYEDQKLISACNWDPNSIWVMDLQTGEGARFALRDKAALELSRHLIWVCPLFEPFLGWLQEQNLENVTRLPQFVDLKDAPFEFRGHRRQGPRVRPVPGTHFEVLDGPAEGTIGVLTSVRLEGTLMGRTEILFPEKIALFPESMP